MSQQIKVKEFRKTDIGGIYTPNVVLQSRVYTLDVEEMPEFNETFTLADKKDKEHYWEIEE